MGTWMIANDSLVVDLSDVFIRSKRVGLLIIAALALVNVLDSNALRGAIREEEVPTETKQRLCRVRHMLSSSEQWPHEERVHQLNP